MWCIYIVAEIDSQGLYIHRKHVGLEDVYGSAPTAVAAAKEYFTKHLKVAADELEKHTVEKHLYLLGPEIGFTFADILLAHCVVWAHSIGWLPDRDILGRYMLEMTSREAYRRCFEFTK